eukprot:15164318-Ditylum_brightwellii.AAC.1
METDGKLLALTGEGGGDFGPPQVLVLNQDMTTKKQVICPNKNVFKEKEAADDTWPVFQASALAATTESIFAVAPIPAFVVYDGLEEDLPATTILEHINNLDSKETPTMLQCAAFLRAAMVKFRKNDTTIETPLA